MNFHQQIEDKILTPETLKTQLSKWREMEMKIVFTNGCFDLLHPGHVDYLSKAAGLGDILLVGLNDDNSVSRLKGENRPILDQHSRAFLLAGLACVSGVILFSEDTPERLLKEITPEILVKGNDYIPSQIAGANYVIEQGGQVILLPLLKGYSTSLIEQKIRGAK